MPAATSQAIDDASLQASRATKEQVVQPGHLRTRRVLAVVDSSERAGRVVQQVKALASVEWPVEAIVLNVQEGPADGRLRGYGSFKREEIRARLLDGLGRRAVTAAGRVLAHAGIEHKHRVELGDPVETILRVAGEEGCDLIVVGSGPIGKLQRWLREATGLMLASSAGQVAQLADRPVLVVK